MYRIELRPVAQRFLRRLPPKDFKAVIVTVNDLASVSRPKGTEKVKGTRLWRVRQGDYRIVYDIDDERQLITVVRIGHRREIYRLLK